MLATLCTWRRGRLRPAALVCAPSLVGGKPVSPIVILPTQASLAGEHLAALRSTLGTPLGPLTLAPPALERVQCPLRPPAMANGLNQSTGNPIRCVLKTSAQPDCSNAGGRAAKCAKSPSWPADAGAAYAGAVAVALAAGGAAAGAAQVAAATAGAL